MGCAISSQDGLAQDPTNDVHMQNTATFPYRIDGIAMAVPGVFYCYSRTMLSAKQTLMQQVGEFPTPFNNRNIKLRRHASTEHQAR